MYEDTFVYFLYCFFADRDQQFNTWRCVAMVITSSDVAMSSGRAYKRQTRDRSSVQGWGEVLEATTSPTATEVIIRKTRKE